MTMAIDKKRMQQRYGTFEQYTSDKNNLLPNEFASVTSGDTSSTDGTALYFKSGTKDPIKVITANDNTFITVPNKEDSANKVVNKSNNDDINTSKYPSLKYLYSYFYDYNGVDKLLENKADKATTLAGYGITDAYTQEEVQKKLNRKLDSMPFDSEPKNNSPYYLTSGAVYNALQTKADKNSVYSKAEADNSLREKADKADVTNQLSELKDDLGDQSSLITTGKNIFNVATISGLGEWCNYTNGVFERNSYVTNYKHSNYIPCKPNTTYARRYGTGSLGTVFFNKHKTYISGVQTDVFTTPDNCSYMVANVSTNIAIDKFMIIESDVVINTHEKFIPYYNDFTYPFGYAKMDDVRKLLKDYVTVGATGGDFTKVGEAFAYARSNDKYVIIQPGIYNLVAEGISGNGYILPKKVIGYGAKLVCNLESEDWNLSPLNTDYRYDAFEVYGLTVECTNCRYCIHDEMGAKTRGSYHNVFKDLHLIHNSAVSDVIIAPNNIGGGCGNHGYIEIDNCVFEQNGGYFKNVDYHSSFTGKQTDQTVIKCRNSVFNKIITCTSIGTSVDFMNEMYVSGCLFGSEVKSVTKNNFRLISWNNEVGGNS